MATNRSTLRSIILTTTGQDVRKCTACQRCYINKEMEANFDLPLTDIVTAARRNDEAALINRTIWVLAESHSGAIKCSNGLDLIAIAEALCQEARLRGFADEEG